MKMLRILLIAALTLALCSAVFAQSGSRIGTAGATQLLIPVGSVGTAMGGSFLANARGIEAIDWNPAGLSVGAKTAQAMFSRMSYIADMDVNYFAAAGKLGDFGLLGLSVKWVDVGEIEATTIDSPEGSGVSINPTIMTLALTYSRAMTDRIHFGVNVKPVIEKFGTVSGSTMAFDFGLQYREGNSGIRFGIALKNLGARMRYDGTALEHNLVTPGQPPDATAQPLRVRLAPVDLPALLEMGIAYDIKVNGHMGLNLSGTYLNHNYATDEYRVGAEWALSNLLYVRGGFSLSAALQRPGANNTEIDEDTAITDAKPSFGFGLKRSQGDTDFALDYAYRPVEFFGNTQWFTLSLGF